MGNERVGSKKQILLYLSCVLILLIAVFIVLLYSGGSEPVYAEAVDNTDLNVSIDGYYGPYIDYVSNWVYGGDPMDVIVTGAHDCAYTITYKGVNEDDSAYTETVPTNAGDYVVRAVTTASSEYNSATATANFTISKDKCWVYLKSWQEVVYGDPINIPIERIEIGLDRTLTEEDRSEIVSGITFETSGDSVGIQTVKVESGETANFKICDVNSENFEIIRRNITIDIDNKSSVYGDDKVPLTASLAAGSKSLVGEDKLEDIVGMFVEQNVPGEWDIIVDNPKNFNYTISVATPGKYTIEKRPLHVTINNAEGVYGDPVPEFTSTVQDGDLLPRDADWAYDISFWSYFGWNPYTQEYEAYNIDVGVYELHVSMNCSYYELIGNPTATFTITPRPITVTADNKQSEYGSELSELTATLSTTLGYARDKASDVYTLTKAEGTEIGEYAITVNDVGNPNYTVTAKNGTYTIVKGTYDMLAVKFEDAEYVYDGTERTLEITGTLPTGVTVSYSNNKLTEAGTLEVTATFTGDAEHYNAIESRVATLKISQEWNVEDPEQEEVKVKINGTKIDSSVKLKVEVKASIDSEEQSTEAAAKAEAVQEQLQSNDRIALVYDVKLVRKTIVAGVETTTTIQPSDIKEGATIEIEMAVPEELQNVSFRILHIHNDETVEEVAYTKKQEAQSITVLTDKLSEFAFIVTDDVPSEVEPAESGLSAGAIVGIVLGSLIVVIALVLCCAFFVLNKWIVSNGTIVRAFKLGTKNGETKVITIKCKIETRPENEVYNNQDDAKRHIIAQE
ncbi:MAG: hypothetical protein K5923_04210 [Clostridia bacterium]|nr:hypothetical protein [Clostridia bacterium]